MMLPKTYIFHDKNRWQARAYVAGNNALQNRQFNITIEISQDTLLYYATWAGNEMNDLSLRWAGYSRKNSTTLQSK